MLTADYSGFVLSGFVLRFEYGNPNFTKNSSPDVFVAIITIGAAEFLTLTKFLRCCNSKIPKENTFVLFFQFEQAHSNRTTNK